MKKVGIRTYELKTKDFPVTVTVRARNLSECNAVISDVHVVKDGVLVGSTPVTVTSDEPSLSKRYEIKMPAQTSPCDMVQALNCWFGKKASINARFEISIASAVGDEFTTAVGVPTIDPGIANLVFQYR